MWYQTNQRSSNTKDDINDKDLSLSSCQHQGPPDTQPISVDAAKMHAHKGEGGRRARGACDQ